MTIFKDIRVEAARIVELTGLPCTPYLSMQINPPCAQIARGEMDPDLVFGQATQVARLVVHVFTPFTEEESGQEKLDEYFDRDGESSIKAKLENGDNWATSLGVDYCRVLSWSEPQLGVDVAGANYITGRINLEVCW